MIKLLGAEWEPDLPASFLVRHEILSSAVTSTPARAAVAALGLTWAHPTVKLKAGYFKTGPNPEKYAETVYQELMAAGAQPMEIDHAAAAALTAISRSMISQNEVEARADFSKASSENSPAESEASAAADDE